MTTGYRLALLAVLIFAQETFQEEEKHLHNSALTEYHESFSQPDDSEPDQGDIDATGVSTLAPFEWTARTRQAFESRRRRPGMGWGAFAPALLAASSILPLLLSGLAALAGKALMSSVLALAVAGFNLFRSGQPNQAAGF